MKKLPEIFESNRQWAARMATEQPGFLDTLARAQSPNYLWIGCSDSRVSESEICGLRPGDMFVHRNIANQAIHTDFSFLSVLQFAVEVLKVSDVIVCGHYGCGGVKASLDNQPLGLIDNWLRHIKDIACQRRSDLEDLSGEAKVDRMCELNVAQQVANVCHTTTVQDAWRRGQPLSVHGWVYEMKSGLLKDLDLCVSALDQLPAIYQVSP